MTSCPERHDSFTALALWSEQRLMCPWPGSSILVLNNSSLASSATGRPVSNESLAAQLHLLGWS